MPRPLRRTPVTRRRTKKPITNFYFGYRRKKTKYRIVVLGDSILWGQGLNDHDKTFTKVAKHIIKTKKVSVNVDVFAHSGAKIGWYDYKIKPRIPGEVPTSHPLIKQQVSFASKPQDVNLVLIDGGINDIEFPRIFNPLNDIDLPKETDRYCNNHMAKLLRSVSKKYSNAKIIVTGYYPIISNYSDLTLIAGLLVVLGFLGGLIIGVLLGGTILGGLSAIEIKRIMVRRSRDFVSLAHQSIKKAVNTVNQENGNNQIKFVDPRFRARNALFADDSWLYTFKLRFSLTEPIRAIDPKRSHRNIVCPQNKSRTASVFICKMASVGHPNKKGADRYFQKIKPHL